MSAPDGDATLAALPELARRMLREFRLDILAELAVAGARAVLGARQAELLLIEEGGLSVAASSLSDGQPPRNLAVAAAAQRAPASAGAWRALPVTAARQIEGVLLLCDAPDGAPAAIELFVGMLGAAIEQARRYAQLESEAVARAHELSLSLEQLRHTQHQLVQAEKLAALGGVIAGVTHEMSTPIGNAMVVATTAKARTDAFAELVVAGQLRRSQLEEFIAHVSEACELIEINLRTAGTLLAQFKEIAADQISERRRVFDLAETLREVLWTYQPLFRGTYHQISAEVPPGITLESYPGPLGQIIGNLIKNAIQHGFDGVRAGAVALRAEPIGPAHVRITFHDSGVGIAPQHLSRVFEPFFTTRLGSGGTGLGLSISYSLATRVLGGSITVSSAAGQGTTFTIELPLVAPLHPSGAPA